MKPATSPILRASLVALALAALSAAALAGDWRQARVRGVGPRPAQDSAINLDCAPAHPEAAAPTVLVISYRVGKSHVWRAFDLSADEHYAVGDEVVVDVAGCRVAHRTLRADAAASAG
jgi:hypothetical protein